MGKHVVTGLLLGLAVFLCSRGGSAQENLVSAPGTTVQTGKFFTNEDFEHVKAALGYLNLTPGDLNYEKKHLDHRFRLGVVNEALDKPLGLPNTAENAAEAFGVNSPPTTRAMTATRLLDYQLDRWSADELLKDVEVDRELERKSTQTLLAWLDFDGDPDSEEGKRVKKAWEDASKAWEDAQSTGLYGEPPELLFQHEGENGRKISQIGPKFKSASDSLMRKGADLRNIERAGLAMRLPELLAEADDMQLVNHPDVELPEEFDLFAEAAKAKLVPSFVAAARICSALELLPAIYAFNVANRPEFVSGSPDHEIEGVTGNVVSAWQSKWGKVVIGGSGANTYEGDDFIGIIDMGGDDTYRGRVACGIGLEGQAPISFVLDLHGDDRYLGEDFTQGFGFLGVGILHDLGAGDDVYKSRFCAQGCGLCGYGELYDDGGDDIYQTDSGSQGAGVFGYGRLIDVSGNDNYRACRYAQGFAQVKGIGVLTDGDGNDVYYAGGKYLHEPLFNDRYQSLSQGFAIGNRRGGETGGGVGMLIDEGDGNDSYTADIYGQGSSYWYSLGMLVDRGGNDAYTLGQYGQGAGIHLSAGILVDEEGDDTYTNPYGVGVGGAHDWSVGWLIDREGNDFYQGNGQGQGLNFSVAILLDCTGNDSHSTTDANSIGYDHNNSIALLLDLKGEKDVYSSPGCTNGEFTKRGRNGLCYDVPQGWFPGIDVSTLPTIQDPPPKSAQVQHILISWKGANNRVTLKDPGRTKEQATELLHDVLKQARTKGADWHKLQEDYSEDSADAGTTYEARPNSALVKSFKDLALSLGIGQIDWCESTFGYHIIKRIQ